MSRTVIDKWSIRMTVRDRLIAALSDALEPLWLEVLDESHLHAGHGGWRPEGETHMRVRVVSSAFTGKSRLERHRLVNTIARGELQSGLHALALEAKSPEEHGQGPTARSRPTGQDGTVR